MHFVKKLLADLGYDLNDVMKVTFDRDHILVEHLARDRNGDLVIHKDTVATWTSVHEIEEV